MTPEELAAHEARHQPTRRGAVCRTCEGLWPCASWQTAAALREAWDGNDRLGAMVEWLAEVIVDARDACQRAKSIEPTGSPEWVESGIAMRTTALREVRAILDRERNAHPSALDKVTAERDEALAAVAAAGDLEALKTVRLAHAGDRSPLALANREIGALPPAAKAEAGKRVGQARGAVRSAIEARQAALEAERDERVLVEEAATGPSWNAVALRSALVAMTVERDDLRAAHERLDRDGRAVAGRCLHYEARAKKAEAAIARVRALCDDAEIAVDQGRAQGHVCGPDCHCDCLAVEDVRAAADTTRPLDGEGDDQ